MSISGSKNRDEIAEIRRRMLQGLISYDEAKLASKPIIDRMNAIGAEIARKSGMRFKPFTFSYLIR